MLRTPGSCVTRSITVYSRPWCWWSSSSCQTLSEAAWTMSKWQQFQFQRFCGSAQGALSRCLLQRGFTFGRWVQRRPAFSWGARVRSCVNRVLHYSALKSISSCVYWRIMYYIRIYYVYIYICTYVIYIYIYIHTYVVYIYIHTHIYSHPVNFIQKEWLVWEQLLPSSEMCMHRVSLICLMCAANLLSASADHCQEAEDDASQLKIWSVWQAKTPLAKWLYPFELAMMSQCLYALNARGRLMWSTFKRDCKRMLSVWRAIDWCTQVQACRL